MLTTRGPVFPQLSHQHPSHSWKTPLGHGSANRFYVGWSSFWGEHALAYFQQECCRARAAGSSPAGPTACSVPDWPTCLPGPRICHEKRKEQQHQRSVSQLLPTCKCTVGASIETPHLFALTHFLICCRVPTSPATTPHHTLQQSTPRGCHTPQTLPTTPTCGSLQSSAAACNTPIPSSASSRVFLRHYHQHFSSSQVVEDLLCPRDECTRACAHMCPPMCCKDCALQS